ncbi:hypothetical protein QQY24_06405 [Streptomyces sp. TG1A-8]|uniref:hypothetical protein n=1 Tax=Streptomyces sp. TG1A-8 TaxID=3051385 RepID=UPI00265C3527|nr:hypothetical protein [Streptomyces sp. TG1A-8]MDO0925067.1 hypothetical protein [Streptomyces sp. TG1A-8]
MARRHTSGFDILGFDFDPTPGDPDLILNQIVPTYTSLGDDAQSAFDALRGNAMQGGTGKTMDALREVIGGKYPPKLQQTADSFHAAAQAYRTYARSLSDAQSQLDRAMDQALPVAGTAVQTVPPPPANATSEQLSAARSQQQDVDQANAELTAAKRLAQDAKDMRDQAGTSFGKNLADVSTVPPRSSFQKFLDFFEHNPLIQIIIDVAIAVVTVFFPIVGLVLGAVAFLGSTVLGTLATGHFDVGTFLVGLAGLATGGLGAAAKFLPAVAKAAEAGNAAARGLPLVGSFFRNDPKPIVQGLGALTKKGLKDFGKSFGLEFGKGVAGGFASTGINDVAEHKQFTGIQAAQIFSGAAAGGVIAGGVKVADKQIFKGPHILPGEKEPPAVGVTPPDDGGPVIHPAPTGGGEPGRLSPGSPDTRPDGAADPAAVAAGNGHPVITVTPPEGSTLRPPTGGGEPGRLQPGSADTRPDGEADAGAFGAQQKHTPPPPTDTSSTASVGGDVPHRGPKLVVPDHEGTAGRQGLDAAGAVIKGLGGDAADVGIAVGLGNDEKDHDGDVPAAIADGATDSLPGIAGAASSGPLHRTVTRGPVGGR